MELLYEEPEGHTGFDIHSEPLRVVPDGQDGVAFTSHWFVLVLKVVPDGQV